MPLKSEDIIAEEVESGFPASLPQEIAPEKVVYKLVLPHVITDAYNKQVDIGKVENTTLEMLQYREDQLNAELAEIQAKRAAIEAAGA